MIIAFKSVHKEGNKYYSLMNYGYCRLNEDFKTKQPAYEIGKTYTNWRSNYKSLKRQFFKKRGEIPRMIKEGFYLTLYPQKPTPIQKQRMAQLGGTINAILKCEVNEENILSYDNVRNGIRVNKFKVLEEIQYEI